MDQRQIERRNKMQAAAEAAYALKGMQFVGSGTGSMGKISVGKDPLDPSKPAYVFEIMDVYIDPLNGLDAARFRDIEDDEVVFAFAGTDLSSFSSGIRDISADMALGRPQTHGFTYDQVRHDVREELNNRDVSLACHSLSSVTATMVGLEALAASNSLGGSLYVECFNGLGVADLVESRFTPQELAKFGPRFHATNHVIKDDPISKFARQYATVIQYDPPPELEKRRQEVEARIAAAAKDLTLGMKDINLSDANLIGERISVQLGLHALGTFDEVYSAGGKRAEGQKVTLSYSKPLSAIAGSKPVELFAEALLGAANFVEFTGRAVLEAPGIAAREAVKGYQEKVRDFFADVLGKQPFNRTKTPATSIPIQFGGQTVRVRGRPDPQARNISLVVDPVQDALGKAGYGPADPDVVADAYVEGRASGLTHQKAVEYAAGKAKELAFEADVRALKEAASWNALAGKGWEQNINKLSDQTLEELTRLETQAREILGVPTRDQTKLTQVASLTGFPISNPATAESEKKQGTGESLWSAVQQETDARRAAELEQDTKELERAYGIEQRRDAAARAADDVVTSVSPSRTGNLGGMVDEMNDAISKAEANRSLTQARGVHAQDLLGGGTGADLLGGGKASQQTPAARRTDSEGEGGQRSYSDEAYDPSLGFTGNLARDAAALGKIGTEAGSAQLQQNREAGRNAQAAAAAEKAKKAQAGVSGAEARVICTELVAQGRMGPELYHLDLRFAQERLSATHLRGYHFWAVPLVRRMRRSRRVSALIAGPALWRAEEIAHLLGERLRGSWRGKIVRLIGEPLCWLIGCWAPETDYRKLYEQENNA